MKTLRLYDRSTVNATKAIQSTTFGSRLFQLIKRIITLPRKAIITYLERKGLDISSKISPYGL